MFDDYDNTSCYIKYDKVFDITFQENEEYAYKRISNEINNIEESYISQELKNIIKKGKSGLDILDPRYISSLSLRYCSYAKINSIKWYLLTFWRR